MEEGIWREGLHRMLWELRYGADLVDISQVDLADQLCVTKYTVNRVIKQMVEEGRLERGAGQTYRITNPDLVSVD